MAYTMGRKQLHYSFHILTKPCMTVETEEVIIQHQVCHLDVEVEGLSPAGVEPVVGHVLGLLLVGGIVVVIIIRVAVDLDLQCDVNVKYFY